MRRWPTRRLRKRPTRVLRVIEKEQERTRLRERERERVTVRVRD